MTRARCDIGDFDPGGVPAIANSAAGWIAMGKHLCGGATDLTLRCGVRSLQTSEPGACTADENEKTLMMRTKSVPCHCTRLLQARDLVPVASCSCMGVRQFYV